MKKYLKHGFKAILIVLFVLLSSIAFLSHSIIDWLTVNYCVRYQVVLYTMTSPLKGSDTSMMSQCIKAIQNNIFILIGFYVIAILVFLFFRKHDVTLKIKLKKLFQFNLGKIILVCVFSLLIASVYKDVLYLDSYLRISDYYKLQKQTSTIYENYYVDPDSVVIKAPEKKKNLIYIYLESMESSYASTSDGGLLPHDNLIPNLTSIAKNNISFSNDSDLGGWYSAYGTDRTMDAMFATTSGVPFSFPATQQGLDEDNNFAPGITVLGDVLDRNGYNQEFLCGSDADFAGRRQYFSQHGNYHIFDYYEAIKEGYIDEDYKVWWGIEDHKLYNIAKDRVTKLANSSKPFNLTMLTVDTHFPGGYVCDVCKDDYDSDPQNVMACADRQLFDFIEWCKTQPFYKDTTIIVTGDHKRMDTVLIKDVPLEKRTVYNAFINVDQKNYTRQKNRVFTAMDMFPTVLSSLNFEIEGNRLGLGTDLLSDKNTLSEDMGFDNFNNQISMSSNYYENFSKKDYD